MRPLCFYPFVLRPLRGSLSFCVFIGRALPCFKSSAPDGAYQKTQELKILRNICPKEITIFIIFSVSMKVFNAISSPNICHYSKFYDKRLSISKCVIYEMLSLVAPARDLPLLLQYNPKQTFKEHSSSFI